MTNDEYVEDSCEERLKSIEEKIVNMDTKKEVVTTTMTMKEPKRPLRSKDDYEMEVAKKENNRLSQHLYMNLATPPLPRRQPHVRSTVTPPQSRRRQPPPVPQQQQGQQPQQHSQQQQPLDNRGWFCDGSHTLIRHHQQERQQTHRFSTRTARSFASFRSTSSGKHAFYPLYSYASYCLMQKF